MIGEWALSEIAEINDGKRPPMRQADKTDNVYVSLSRSSTLLWDMPQMEIIVIKF